MKGEFSPGVVVAVSRSAIHQFSKPVLSENFIRPGFAL